MSKIIKFKREPSTVRVNSVLTEEESRACDLARSLREMFTDAQVDEIRNELTAELGEEDDDEG